MKKDYTHLTLVVDRSGSMHTIAKDAEGGINSLIEEQSKLDGELTISLYEFDQEYNRVFGPVSASEAPVYHLVPRGSTALLDATGRAIAETGEFLRNLDEADRPDQVMFVVVTDGHENASCEYTKDQIKTMVKEQEDKYSWDFAFLGANVDAFAEGSSFGFNNTMQYASNSQAVMDSYTTLNKTIHTNRVSKQRFASTLPQDASDAGDISSNVTSA